MMFSRSLSSTTATRRSPGRTKTATSAGSATTKRTSAPLLCSAAANVASTINIDCSALHLAVLIELPRQSSRTRQVAAVLRMQFTLQNGQDTMIIAYLSRQRPPHSHTLRGVCTREHAHVALSGASHVQYLADT